MKTLRMDNREKTLMVAVLLSMWGPLVTGIAVAMSQSSTQLADFIRRSVELVALIVSWRMYRFLSLKQVTEKLKEKMENIATKVVALSMFISGLAMMLLVVRRFYIDFSPSGSVWLGMTIALLGLLTNGFFWRRYRYLNVQEPNQIIHSQSALYRAKTLVDMVVVLALLSIVLWPNHVISRNIDLLGSILVSLYLMYNSYRTWT